MRKWTPLGRIKIFGAPVYIHWSVLVGIVVLALLSFGSPIHAALAIASYLAIIAIHEIGHAYAASRRGYEIRAIRIAAVHGQCEYSAPETETDEIAIAWAGVAAQLVVAVPILIVAAVVDSSGPNYLGPIVVFLGYFNLLIALINLAPAPGLDGHIAWGIFRLLFRQRRATSTAKKIIDELTSRK